MTAHNNRVGRESIVQRAGKLFTERGYQAVSIREIADACGVTNAALYYYFENKSALYAEVIQQHARTLNETIRRAAAGAETYQSKINAMAKTYLEIVSDQRPLMNLIRIQKGDQDHLDLNKNIVDILKTVLGPFDEVIQAAEAAGEVEKSPEGFSESAVLVGMLHGLIGYKKICHQERITDGDVERIIGLFWRGITKPK